MHDQVLVVAMIMVLVSAVPNKQLPLKKTTKNQSWYAQQWIS